jgi:hypothetical protein
MLQASYSGVERVTVEAPMGIMSMGSRALWTVKAMAEEAAVAAGLPYEDAVPMAWRALALRKLREHDGTEAPKRLRGGATDAERKARKAENRRVQEQLKAESADLARRLTGRPDMGQDAADAWWIAYYGWQRAEAALGCATSKPRRTARSA